MVTHMCSLDYRRPVRATRQDFALELGALKGATGDWSNTPHYTSTVRRSNVDVFVGNVTLQSIDEAKMWLPHGMGPWIVGIAWRVLRFCCGYHDCCGLNREDSEVHVSGPRSTVIWPCLISESMVPFKYDMSLVRSHRIVLAEEAEPRSATYESKVGPNANLRSSIRQVDAKDKHSCGRYSPRSGSANIE